jgi:hypothetical protein
LKSTMFLLLRTVRGSVVTLFRPGDFSTTNQLRF